MPSLRYLVGRVLAEALEVLNVAERAELVASMLPSGPLNDADMAQITDHAPLDDEQRATYFDELWRSAQRRNHNELLSHIRIEDTISPPHRSGKNSSSERVQCPLIVYTDLNSLFCKVSKRFGCRAANARWALCPRR